MILEAESVSRLAVDAESVAVDAASVAVQAASGAESVLEAETARRDTGSRVREAAVGEQQSGEQLVAGLKVLPARSAV